MNQDNPIYVVVQYHTYINAEGEICKDFIPTCVCSKPDIAFERAVDSIWLRIARERGREICVGVEKMKCDATLQLEPRFKESVVGVGHELKSL